MKNLLIIPEQIGAFLLTIFAGVGRFLIFVRSISQWIFIPPFRTSLLFKQLEFVGNKSFVIISNTVADHYGNTTGRGPCFPKINHLHN